MMPHLDFDPRRDGFHFENDFVNHVLDWPLRWETAGRCGGMAAAALDYYRARIPIPTHKAEDLPANRLGRAPAEGTRLSQYIYDRLLTTILRPEGLKFVLGPWVTDADCYRWSMGTEFVKVARRIDAGLLTIVGLWGKAAGNPGAGHQVVCYGYDTNPQRLWVYDNNHRDEGCWLVGRDPRNGVAILRADGRQAKEYRGFFFHDVFDWEAAESPPHYVDLAVSGGIALEPGEQVPLGGRLRCSVTVRNYGEYPSHLKGLMLYARGPGSENIDHLLGGLDANPTPINPGQERVLVRDCGAFGLAPGVHVVGVSYLSHLDYWRPLPPGPGAANAMPQRLVSVLRPGMQQVQDREVRVPESSADVDTGIDVAPGEDIAFQAWDSIWSGTWATGRNGPAGWSSVSHDPKFPLHNGSDAHPFALLGRYSGLGYFYIGTGGDRAPYAGGVRRRLFLRINDDMPGNGAGAFRCRVSVWR
ncbi:hypothetical protein ACVWZW_008373 [Bradyrhizobium sp. F1.13.4]